MLDLQRASLLKRLSAAIFDFILLIVAITGFAWIIGNVINYDAKLAEFETLEAAYEQQYTEKFGLTEDEIKALPPEEQTKYNEEAQAFAKELATKRSNDTQYINSMSLLIQLTFIIISFSVLLSYLFLEFAVPLLFKNGQTMGKKIFSVALMREDGVKITPTMLFIRTVLGKYTIETMVPIAVILMIFMTGDLLYSIIIMAIFFGNLILLFATKKHTAIHDKMAGTVAVDMQSQLIFKSPEELLKYKQKLHQEKIENTKS